LHIPPGFLKPSIWLPMGAFSAACVGYAMKKTGHGIDERSTPVMGVMAAFIFAAQMINFPVFGGTSGHLIGASLAVAVLGMWPAMVVMTAVVIMQALLFQDGGLEALGANVFNLGILGCIVSGPLIAFGKRFGKMGTYISLAFAGWLSVVLASFFCAVELALSGTSPLQVVLPAMLIIHAVIGAFEGVIGVIAFRFICAVNPGISMTNGEVKSCGAS